MVCSTISQSSSATSKTSRRQRFEKGLTVISAMLLTCTLGRSVIVRPSESVRKLHASLSAPAENQVEQDTQSDTDCDPRVSLAKRFRDDRLETRSALSRYSTDLLSPSLQGEDDHFFPPNPPLTIAPPDSILRPPQV